MASGVVACVRTCEECGLPCSWFRQSLRRSEPSLQCLDVCVCVSVTDRTGVLCAHQRVVFMVVCVSDVRT